MRWKGLRGSVGQGLRWLQVLLAEGYGRVRGAVVEGLCGESSELLCWIVTWPVFNHPTCNYSFEAGNYELLVVHYPAFISHCCLLSNLTLYVEVELSTFGPVHGVCIFQMQLRVTYDSLGRKINPIRGRFQPRPTGSMLATRRPSLH